MVIGARSVVAIAPNGGGLEPEVLRWFGVAAVIVGVLVSSPDAVKEIGRDLLKVAQRSGQALRRLLALVIPKLRPSPPSLQGRAQGSATAAAQVTATVTRAWVDTWTPDEKVENLHRNVEELWAAQKVAMDNAAIRYEELRREIGEVRERQHESTAELQRRLDVERDRSIRFDARGLPLVGLGTIMTGIPDELAHFAVVGWSVVAVSAAVFALVVYRSVQRGTSSSH